MKIAHPSQSWRQLRCLLILVPLWAGCDATQPSAPGTGSGVRAQTPEEEMAAYRKTLPPIPDSLKPLAQELEQLYSRRVRPPLSEGPMTRIALPGQLPYKMAEGGKLIEVDLMYVPVTDDFLKKMAALPDLATLDLSGTKITDVGLDNLSEAPALKDLSIFMTQVTQEGAEKFRELHPNCKVHGPAFDKK